MRRLLLDTSSLFYRAFFALPDSIRGPDGRPTNAIHGYLNMTAQLIRTRTPDEVVHALDDDWKPAPRVASYAGYKSQRPDEPKEITDQFEVLFELLDHTGMRVADAEGWEAEDAIGSLVATTKGRDRDEVVTGDRDLIQLVRDPHVKVLLTRKGVSDLADMDAEAVQERFGVPADRYADFAILRGDPSDALPGVPGVGEKTAVALVKAYPSIEAMVADSKKDHPAHRPLKGSPGLRARVRAAEDYLAAMLEVVPIRTDLKVRSRSPKRNDKALDQLAEQQGLSGPIGRVRAAQDGAA